MLPGIVRTVGIIDGVFHQSLAVSPKEILPLLERGVRVYGASSIGALRAAELREYGMTGVGKIYEMYRDGTIDADDEVAVAYDPETGRAVSEPLVNIRVTLEAAVAQQVVSRTEAETVIRSMRDIYYPMRSYSLVETVAPMLGPFLKRARRDQKREDALLLLEILAAEEAELQTAEGKNHLMRR